MTDDPRLTPLATSLPASVPFVGPEVQERAQGFAFDARLGANENGFGPAPSVHRAIAAAGQDIWKYPDADSHDLKAALAAHHGLTPAHLAIDAGIDTLLGVLVRLLVGPGDAVVTSLGAYPTFNYHVAGFGGALHTVPYAGDFEDIDRLLAKARETQAKLIYLSNPDNPMGSHHSAADVAAMIRAVPDGCLLILDEAYAETAPADALPPLEPADSRVIRMRTFSKAYGLAGARVGYAIGPVTLIRAFDKVRNHFGMSRLSQAAALAALADQDYLAAVTRQVVAARDHLAAIAVENGLRPLPSAANFVTMDCGRDGAFATHVLTALRARRVFVRMPGVAPLNRCIRVSCGPETELAAFAAALPGALAEATEMGEIRPT